MSILTVSTAWKPTNGQHYASVEVRMADDFQRADAAMWGLVEAKGLTNTTTFDRLRIVGRREWFPRFDWINIGEGAHSWQEALGGAAGGGTTALAGLMAQDCKKLHIKQLELVGIPGAGVHFARTGLQIDSMVCDRVGWPLYQDYDSIPNARISRISSMAGHWRSKAWHQEGFPNRAISLRRLDETHDARGELVLNGSAWILEDYSHHGDGISFKVAGTQFLVRRCHVGAAFYNGTVPQNAITFPDPVRYKHLHESRGCATEDTEFLGCASSAQMQPRALLYVSYPFTDPLIFRRCVFMKGTHLYAFQINWASVVCEDCDFIGWTEANAFELSPAHDGMPAATVTYPRSRFYAS